MDDLAQSAGLAPAERGERARAAFDLYAKTYGGSEIEDLITDLMHLADEDREDGGIEVLMRAGTHYSAEVPGGYLAQVRHPGEGWMTMGGTLDARDTAEAMLLSMQRAGFKATDMEKHIEALIKGEVLTAAEGLQFRVIESDV